MHRQVINIFHYKKLAGNILNHEDQHLCSGEGLVIGSNASPHIRTCWCRRGYEGDGFFCEGIVMVIFPENLSV